MGLVASVLLAILLAGSPMSVSVAAAGQTRAGTAVRPAGGWAWPVGAGHRIIRPFLAPATTYSAGHRGIDIAGEPGAVVVAPDAGIVHFAGIVVDRPVISIRHADGVISSFEPVMSDLADGTPVARGSPIGTLESGHCSVGCLHFGVRVHGEYVSPLLYLDGIPRAVLLPTRNL